MPFVNTENTPRIISLPIPFDLWSAVNTGVTITSSGQLGPGLRILDASIEKAVAFDAGSVLLGHGTVTAQRITFATGAEVDCTTLGMKRLDTWRSGTDGGYNALMATANRAIVARFEGASLPTQGQMILHITVLDLSPRTTL